MFNGAGFRLDQLKGNAFGGTRADTGQFAERGDEIRDGSGKHASYINPGRAMPAVTLPISALEISLAWFNA